MRVSLEPGEASVRVKKNGAEIGIARPGSEINELINAGDNIALEAFDEAAEAAADKTGEQQGEQQEGDKQD